MKEKYRTNSRVDPFALSRKGKRNTRKNILFAGNTISVTLQPSCSNESTHKDNTALDLFGNLKDCNKVVIKGLKIIESLEELRLSAVLFPYTLLLTGPYEDLKVIKQAWIKRYLKNPKGYFIREIGIVQDLTIEVIPQSPFMSLSTALFDAVADLNSQKIYPSKNSLYQYLQKHYAEIKTPDLKMIHECLGRLIQERRLYHNGRGYFILHNENVLNEVIAFKSLQNSNALEGDRVKEFALGSSLNSSSLSDDTECKTSSSNATKCKTLPSNDIAYKTSPSNVSECKTLPGDDIACKILSPNVIDFKTSPNNDTECKILPSDDIANKTLPNNVTECKTSPSDDIACNTFPRDGSESKKVSTNDRSNNKVPPLGKPYDVHTSSFRSNKTNDFKGYNNGLHPLSQDQQQSSSRLQRSFSFSGYETDQSYKEVHVSSIENGNRNNIFEKSYSFGMGPLKRSVKRSLVEENSAHEHNKQRSQDSRTSRQLYGDNEISQADEEISTSASTHCPDMKPIKTLEVLNHYNNLGSSISLSAKMGMYSYTASDFFPPSKTECLAEELKMAFCQTPIHTFELDGCTNNTTVINDDRTNQAQQAKPRSDVLITCVETKLAAQNSYIKPDTSTIKTLLSPRSRRKYIGTQCDSQYVDSQLANVSHSADPESVLYIDHNHDNKSTVINDTLSNDSSNNHNKHGKNISTKLDKKKTAKPHDFSNYFKDSTAIKLRTRSKSNESKRKTQKERNSMLFEEKRSSLKIMGLV